MALYRKYLKKCKTELSKSLQDIYNTENENYDDINSRLESLAFYFYYFNEIHKHTLNQLIIKKTNNYCILKEQYTETVFFVSKDLIVFYIKEQDYEDFYLSFVYSESYKMIMYKYELYYIAFCISHKSRDIDNIKRFLMLNNNDIRMTILSYFINENEVEIRNDEVENEVEIRNDEVENEVEIRNDEVENESKIIYPENLEYHGIIILNRDIFSYLDKKKYKLEFESIIGYGEEIPELINLVNSIKIYIDNNTHMPPHFLDL